MKVGFSDSCFATACGNMRYDETLFHTQGRHLRIYEWPSPGLTYSYKQDVPDELRGLDHAKRITGGGLVFHSPGDIPVTWSGPLDDPAFPARLKEKMKRISEWIQSALTQAGVSEMSLTPSQSHASADIAFCQSYPNPFEIRVKNQKAVGLTLRKNRHRFLIQGIIHLKPAAAVFGHLPKPYHPYFPVGIPELSPELPDLIKKFLRQEAEQSF